MKNCCHHPPNLAFLWDNNVLFLRLVISCPFCLFITLFLGKGIIGFNLDQLISVYTIMCNESQLMSWPTTRQAHKHAGTNKCTKKCTRQTNTFYNDSSVRPSTHSVQINKPTTYGKLKGMTSKLSCIRRREFPNPREPQQLNFYCPVPLKNCVINAIL